MVMNCVRCNVPLEANARFCRNCGLPVAVSQAQEVRPSLPEQATENILPVVIPQDQQKLHLLSTPPYLQQQNYQQQQVLSQTPSTPQSVQSSLPALPSPVAHAQGQSPVDYYQPRNGHRGTKMPPAAVNVPQPRSRIGCVLGCLSALVVLVLVVIAAWIFALRPYIHDTATTQMDNAMTSAVNQIPAAGVFVPPGTTLPIQEGVVNSLLGNSIASSDAVQNTNMQIATSGILLNFKLYGQDCTISAVPQVQNGKLIAKNVTVSGVISFVMSSKDVTALLNKHLEDAQARINHNITDVRLLDHEIDLMLE
ncbi:MAG: hypothetical protein NVS4B12_08430 [Ktedonobacteraceae bacterium]